MSANPTNILPFRDTLTLDQLVELYVAAKRAEETANRERILIEEQILTLAPADEEGSTTTSLASGMKLTTTGKLSYGADDLSALRAITAKWDANLVPLKTTTTLDTTGCKYLRRERPELWAELSRVVTVKPAKTSISVKV
jgi:hypothetical protein